MKPNKSFILLLAVYCTAFATSLVAAPYTIYSIGDSTMADKPLEDSNPERGWCQALAEKTRSEYVFENHGVNGRSSKSFIDEGRWETVLAKLKPNDWVIVQFGHNDQKEYDPKRYTNPYSGYRANLERFIRDAQSKKAHVLIASSIVRRKFNEQGTLIDTHGPYPFVARQVALENSVAFVDLQLITENEVRSLGPEASKRMYLWLEPGETPRHPDGKQDDTHLNETGATRVATLFLQEIDFQGLALRNAFAD